MVRLATFFDRSAFIWSTLFNDTGIMDIIKEFPSIYNCVSKDRNVKASCIFSGYVKSLGQFGARRDDIVLNEEFEQLR